MAYKKYITKNGKKYGPYMYENKRVKGKVITQYVGKYERKKEKKLFTSLLLAIIIGLVIISVSYYSDDIERVMTGQASGGSGGIGSGGDDDSSGPQASQEGSSGGGSSSSTQISQAEDAAEIIQEEVETVEEIEESITQTTTILQLEALLEDIQDSFANSNDNLETIILIAEKNPSTNSLQETLTIAQINVDLVKEIEDKILDLIKTKAVAEEEFKKEVAEKTIRRIEKRKKLVQNDLSKIDPVILSEEIVKETIILEEEIIPEITQILVSDFIEVEYEQKIATNRKVFVDWKVSVTVSEQLPEEADISFGVAPLHENILELEIAEAGSATITTPNKDANNLGVIGEVVDFIFGGTEQTQKENAVSFSAVKPGETYTFFYRTEAPKAVKSFEEDKVIVSVSSNDDLHYEYVVVEFLLEGLFPDASILPEDVSSYRVYWIEEERFINDISIYQRTNADDEQEKFFQFIVPHTSNQTFEIIVITNAEHLDQNRTFISTIYDEVFQLDEIWSETIPDTHYVRAMFEKNLTAQNDITIYPRTISGTPRIDIYEKDEEELLASFQTINDNQYNTVYLTELIGEQDTFDLHIVGGSVEFDHIIDPSGGAPDVSFGSETPADGSKRTTDDVFVELDSADVDDHYAFTDFGNDLILRIPFDEVDANGNPHDTSSYSQNILAKGDPAINESGHWGNGTFIDGDDYFMVEDTDSLDAEYVTVAAWINTEWGDSFARIVNKDFSYTMYYLEESDRCYGNLFNETDSFNWVTSLFSAPHGVWNHCVLVYNGTWWGAYVNGVLNWQDTGTPDLTGPLRATTNNISIGARINGANPLKGSIDDVMIFNRPLSATEIAALYNATATQYQHNYTSITEGDYSYRGYAVDTLGNQNQTEERSVIINRTTSVVYTLVNDNRANYSTLTGIPTSVSALLSTGEGMLWLYNENVLVTNNTNVVNTTIEFSDIGTYNITAIYQGNENYTEGYETWWVEVGQGFDSEDSNSDSGSKEENSGEELTNTPSSSPDGSSGLQELLSTEDQQAFTSSDCVFNCVNVGSCRPANSFTPTVFTTAVIYPSSGVQGQECSVVCKAQEPFISKRIVSCVPDQDTVDVDVVVEETDGTVGAIVLVESNQHASSGRISVINKDITDIIFTQHSDGREEVALSPELECFNSIRDSQEEGIDCGGPCDTACKEFVPKQFPWKWWALFGILLVLFLYVDKKDLVKTHFYLIRAKKALLRKDKRAAQKAYTQARATYNKLRITEKRRVAHRAMNLYRTLTKTKKKNNTITQLPSLKTKRK